MTETTIATFALVVSCVALLYSVWLNRKLLKVTSLSNNLNATINVEKMIGENENFLKFHNIDPKKLDEIGITKEELSYILLSFTIGGLYYKVNSDNTEPFKNEYPESYRYRICQSEHTQKAWEIIKDLMSDSNYKKKIENTINMLKK